MSARPLVRALASLLALGSVAFGLSGCLLAPAATCVEGSCAVGTCNPSTGRCEGPDSGGTDAGPIDAGMFDAGDQTDAGSDGGMSDGGVDSGPDSDGGSDAGGQPPHCSNGVLDSGETSLDCGGPDACPCVGCQPCEGPADCRSGICTDDRCEPVLSTVSSARGPRPAFVRQDGAVLLAHYGPNDSRIGYDPFVSQMLDDGGGADADDAWAPDPCEATGHIAFRDFDPSGREVLMECGNGLDAIMESVSNSGVFTEFTTSGTRGTYGTNGTAGAPGWGLLAATGDGRGFNSSCGRVENASFGGIAYCDGPSTADAQNDFGNHMISYGSFGTSATVPPRPLIGCGGTGCFDGNCPLEIWVWLRP